MFEYAESVPHNVFPSTTVRGNTVGPVVYTTLSVLDKTVLVAFNGVEFWECVKTGLPLLSEQLLAELVRLAGGVTQAEADGLRYQAEKAETTLADARADLDELAVTIAERVAQVIDLDTERAKRRPEAAPAA